MSSSPIPQNNSTGIALMIAAMAGFACSDALIKLLSATMSPAQVLIILTGGGLLFFVAIAVREGAKLVDRAALSKPLLIRYAAEITGMVGMITALATAPLSTVGIILQASPLVVTLGAVTFLGERVGVHRWSAIVVGFLGVVLILRPGTGAFEPSLLWAVMAMFGLSVRDLVTRITPPGMATSSLAAYTMVAALPVAVVWAVAQGQAVLVWEANWWLIVITVALGSTGYLLLIASIRMAPVSVVSPFRYARLVFLLALGMIFFGERPDAATWAGAGLIMASGLYMMFRERKAA
ncbi:MAG: DMT family transporter [Pseudomonadota bacterium]